MNRIADLLPPLQACKSVECFDGDVLVHAPGFEDRALAIPEMFGDSARNAKGILLDYVPKDPRNRLVEVRGRLAARGVAITDSDVLQYNRFEPGDFETRLHAKLQGSRARRVILDVSTMSKLAIILVLNVCCRLQVEVFIVYAEAEAYGPNQEEFEDAKRRGRLHQPSVSVFTGVHGVVRVDSLSSVAMQGQPTAAIVFMSFNDALTQVLLNTVYPSRLLLINSRPPYHRWREEATAWIHDQVRREWEGDNPVVSGTHNAVLPKRVVSTLDYRETVEVVSRLYWDLSVNHRILLAPAGSKLQAIGCYFAKALYPDIQVEYPSPKGFKPPYSSGTGDRWALDLGQLSATVATISNAERRNNLQVRIVDSS